MIQMFRSRTIAALATLAMFAAVATPTVSAAPKQQPPLSVPVVGTVPTGETFTGTLAVTSFAVQDGQVVARGVLTGILTSLTGVPTTIVSAVAAPVRVADTTCEILHLDIAPIFLDLLGLQVSLSRVVLDVVAQAGAGNLL